MLRLIHFDLKRLFANKVTLALSILTPVVTLALFAWAVVPLMFSYRAVEKETIVVLNEDQDEYMDEVFADVVNEKSIQNVVSIEFVDSKEEGIARVESGDAIIFFAIPEGTMMHFYYREPSTVSVWISGANDFETALFLPIFDHVVEMFNQSQLGLDFILDEMLTFAPQRESYDRFNEVMIYLGIQMLSRADLYRMEGISPLGKFLPIEFYISSLFALFLGFGTIPLVGYNVSDFQSTAFTRGIAHFHWPYTFLFTRVLTGTAYILLVSLPMLAISFFIFGTNAIFGGSLPALLGVVLLTSLVFSVFATFLSLLFTHVDSAAWVSFFVVLTAAIVGGALLPSSYLPEWINRIGVFSPIQAAMQLTGHALFNYDPSRMGHGLVVLLVTLAVLSGLSLVSFRYRRQA